MCDKLSMKLMGDIPATKGNKMDQKKIDRISELTRISRERELTPEEQQERAILRGEYIAAFKQSLVSSLDNTYIVDEKGNKRKVERKAKRKMDSIKKGRYRHFKGGEYRVIDFARHSETLEEMVVYEALYGEGGLWVRPASMWNEEIERDGKKIKRFEFIGEEK